MEIHIDAVESTVIKGRQSMLRQRLIEARMESMVLTPGPSFYYLTGLSMSPSERPVVAFFPINAEPVFVLPRLETEQLRHLPFKHEVFEYGENPSEWQFSFDQAAAYCSIFDRQIGIEHQEMRVSVLRHLQESAWTTKFVDASNILADFRGSKDTDEISSIRRAVQIAEQALEATINSVRVGQTEAEIAGRLLCNLLEAGSATSLPFQPIVASGPNSANPHATPSERRLAAGDILLVDWGARYNQYCSDLTRVFSLGDPDPEMANIAAIVAEANEAAQKVAGPGVPVSEVDSAARTTIFDAGYGQKFTHRTGHGLGLAVHEPPYVRSDSDLPLEQGMTFTIEPGIYIPGKGGIRIEDDVLITANGCESLSSMNRKLVVIEP